MCVRVAVIIVALLATVFALSNNQTATLMFLQWPIYTGPVALPIIAAGVLGALLMYLTCVPSIVRQGRLRKRVHELEGQLAPSPPMDRPPAAPDAPSSGPR
jgi:uncharacterized integral membrane protein